MRKEVFVVEVDRCIGCKSCLVSCKMGNQVPLGASRDQVKQVGPIGKYPDLSMYFLPTMCQQCENPSCVNVCPTGACYKRGEDGIVVIDRSLCIGCKSCERACPYQVNTYNEELNVMDKCDTCYERRADGKLPYCVQNCPGECLHVGDINDPQSEVSQILAKPENKDYIFKLRDQENEPSTLYILKRDTWQDVLPQDCHDTKRGYGKHEK